MTTLSEIESATEKLSASQVDELATWLESLRARQVQRLPADRWLEKARRAARPGVSTVEIVSMTRDAE